MEWRDIPGFEGYRISENGDVQTRWVKHGCKSWLGDEWKDMKTYIHKGTGYHRVNLRYAPSKKKMRQIHVLVLLAFVGPPPEGMISLHEDDNKDNNTLKNLRWGTHKENSADSLKNGHRLRGDNHHFSKVNEEIVNKIRLSTDDDETEGEKWGISASNIYKIRIYQKWNHDNVPIKYRGKFQKLTEEQYEEIRNSTETTVALAKKFGVSQSHVSHIKLGHRRLQKKEE